MTQGRVDMQQGWQRKKRAVGLLGVVLLISSASVVYAQEIPFDPNEQPTSESFKVVPPKEQPANPAPNTTVPTGAPKRTGVPGELGALGTLSPFSDIAVIQKRFLPKTKRIEVYPNFGLILNDAFFTNTITGLRVGYYFKEKYGIELMGLVLGTSEKTVTTRLRDGLSVVTRSLVTPQAYYGAAFKWSPIYGKLGFLDDRIVPFDMYFLIGGGMTKTNQDTTPATLHLGMGQLFAIRKWLAFRWDISGFWYQSNTTIQNRQGGTYSNMHATVGVSFFFPEADYR